MAAERDDPGPWTAKLFARAGIVPAQVRVVAARPKLPTTSDGRRPVLDSSVRDAVNNCTDRGPEGRAGTSGGCSGCGGGAELTACAAGKGAIAGRVTLRECINCQAARLGVEEAVR